MSLEGQYQKLSDLFRPDLFELYYKEAADETADIFGYKFKRNDELIDLARQEWISLYIPLQKHDYPAAKFVLLAIQALIEACAKYEIIVCDLTSGSWREGDFSTAFARRRPSPITALHFGLAVYCIERNKMPVIIKDFIMPDFKFKNISFHELRGAVEIMDRGSYKDKIKGFLDIFRKHTKGMVDPTN